MPAPTALPIRGTFRHWLEKPRKWLRTYYDDQQQMVTFCVQRGDYHLCMFVPLLQLENTGQHWDKRWRKPVMLVLLEMRDTMRNKKEK